MLVLACMHGPNCCAGVLLSGLSLPGQPGGALSSWASFPDSAEADRQQQPALPLSMTQQVGGQAVQWTDAGVWGA